MNIILPEGSDNQGDERPGSGRGSARPTTCPLCGLTADNAVVVRGEIVASATYCCTEGHLFAVTWGEVA